MFLKWKTVKIWNQISPVQEKTISKTFLQINGGRGNVIRKNRLRFINFEVIYDSILHTIVIICVTINY